MHVLYQKLISNGWIPAGLFGASAFLAIAGLDVLDPTNLSWIYRANDVASSYTGWTFYRYAPWEARIALNPDYGMDFSGSIIFSDAMPIMAIIFKALSPILPEPFQYHGLWVFMSFVLQGVFGWLLMSRATDDPLVRLLGAIFLVLTPLYYYRLTSCTHMSLTAHWTVLAALCLCLPRQARRPWLWWGLLLTVSAFAHIYLFAMVAALWCADLARRAYLEFRQTWFEPIVLTPVVAFAIWGSGVWSGPTGVFQGGFNWFRMNVLSFMDPNPWNVPDRVPWSYVMPDIPSWGGDYEGFAYLGLGGLILAVLAAFSLPQILRQYPLKPFYAYAPLALALVGMGIFSFSQNVGFGTINFWAPWPAPLRMLGELFRSTGRFIWPLYYVFFFLAVAVISRRFSPRVTASVLAVLAVIQAVDALPGWRHDAGYLRGRDVIYQTALRSPFWDKAAERYKAVRLAPHSIHHEHYLDVATMARREGIVTDSAYLSRASVTATDASRARIEHGIATGTWPSDTMFIVDENIARRASATLDLKRSLLVRVDGLIVLAPEWSGCADCGAQPYLR